MLFAMDCACRLVTSRKAAGGAGRTANRRQRMSVQHAVALALRIESSWQLTCDVLPVEPPPVDVGPLRECSWSYDMVNSAMVAGGYGAPGVGREVCPRRSRANRAQLPALLVPPLASRPHPN